MRLSSMLSTMRGESGLPLPGRSSIWARLALRQRPRDWLYFPVSAEESRTAAESVCPSLFQLLLAPVPSELPGGSRARTASWAGVNGGSSACMSAFCPGLWHDLG